MYIAALDGGKTKTTCAVLDSKGNVLSYATAGPSGSSLLDPVTVSSNIAEAISEALRRAKLTIEDIGVASLTICDLDTAELAEEMKKRILRIGFRGEVLLEPDYVGAYYLATRGRPGVSVIAGTGSVAYGEDGHGKSARAGGWGWLVGDEGSGVWIGVRALNAAARAYDGTGHNTSLLHMIREELSMESFTDLLNVAYRDGKADVTLASRLPPLVVRAAEQGDDEATRILREASRELSLIALAVSRKLGLDDKLVVGCVGSVFKSSLVLDSFKGFVRQELKKVEFRGPYVDYQPLLGPVMMASKRKRGLSSLEARFDRIIGDLEGASRH